ncbi:MAG: immunoglobulin domain-containing protein, partial [Ignavibacteria bacterium]|nr:immunoglobulin domain-containing protein [Ignavibacteria bacterium]
AVQVSGTLPADLVMDENNFYTFGNALSNLGATLTTWQNATGKDINSTAVIPVFLSDENPRLAKIDPKLYLKSPLPELIGTNWQDEVERTDIDGTPRLKAFYKGVNNLNPNIRILEQPQDLIGCVGKGGYYLSTVAEIDFGGELYFQWYFNGQPVSGATQPMLMLPTLTHEMAGVYHCVVSGNGEADPVETDRALLYAIRPTKITRQPTIEYVHQGDVVSFQIDMHITPEEQQYAQPIIQWYRGTTPLQDNDRIAGANSSILTIRDIKPIDFANNYYVIVRGLCGADTSKPITLTEKPKIVIQPLADVEGCKGSNIEITVNASSTVAGYTLQYQWRFNGSPISDNSKYSGTNTATLTINNLDFTDAGQYDVVVIIPGFDEQVSNAANLVVYVPPQIITNLPTTLSVEQGKELRLKIEANGDNLSYQWFKNDNPIPFTTNELLIPSATTNDAGFYKVKVQNQCGEVWSVECQVTVTFKTILKGENQNFELELYQNTPNPFNNITKIEFTLPEAKFGQITITNPFGETVAVFKGIYSSGLNVIEVNSEDLKLIPGVYFYTLEVEGKKLTRKMLYIK